MLTRKLSHKFPIFPNAILIFFVLFGSLAWPTKTDALGVAIEVNTTADNTIQNGFCSLREAIVNANNNNQSHTDCSTGFSDDGIFFSNALGAATITLTSPLPAIKDPVGLTINGGGDITLSGANLHQVFSVNPAGYLILDSLTIKNGKSSVTNIGGAIWNAGKLEIKNSTLSNNSATSGGAIFNGIAQLAIANSSFTNNKAAEGGAINNEGGRVVIENTWFSDNSATNTGGAIRNVFTASGPGTSLTIAGTSFAMNTSKYGGGIYNTKSAQLNLKGSSLFKNIAHNMGGGIYNLGGISMDAGQIFSNSAKTGGGIYNDSGLDTIQNINVIIQNSSLKSNVAETGAGIYNKQSGLSIDLTEISENMGVGLYNFGGNIIITDGTFFSNIGHAIYNHGEDNFLTLATLRIENTRIFNNSGVGVYNDFGKSNIFTSTFQKNGSTGLYNVRQSVVTVDRSSFIGNQGKYGGGIYNENSDLHVHNSTLYANSASQGGGLYNAGTVYILNSSFSTNKADQYDGVYNGTLARLELYNTIIAQSADCTNAPGGVVVGNNNLIQSQGPAACDFINGVDGNLIGVAPDFGLPTGSPMYLPLEVTSPALDAGDDAQCAMLLNQSQNGVTRPQGAHCDIGSYEAPAKKE